MDTANENAKQHCIVCHSCPQANSTVSAPARHANGEVIHKKEVEQKLTFEYWLLR